MVIRVMVVIGFKWRVFFSLLLLGVLLFKTPEGVVVGFQIFEWAPKKNNKILGIKSNSDPHLLEADFLVF